MKLGNRLIKMLIIFLNLSLLTVGWFYEAPIGSRKVKLLILSVLLLVNTTVIVIDLFKAAYMKILFVVGIIINIAVLEFYAKFAIDYFYHSLFILLMIYVLVYLPKKQGIILGIVATGISFIKFIELVVIQPNIGNVSLFIFYGIIQTLVLIIAIIARNYFEEGKKTKKIYLQLLDTYRQLEDSSKEVERLSMEKARTKIARDLHDTLGHDMTGLIMQLEMGSRLFHNNQIKEGQILLEASKKSARESLTKVRQIVQALKNGEDESRSLSSIEYLIETFSEKTGVEITFKVSGSHSMNPEVSIGLYRLIQEGLTNSVRHGKANSVTISLEFLETSLVVNLDDDGKGCKELHKGNGLIGMEERINTLKGILSLKCDHGFHIEANIPYY